jgi:CRISPR-associated protein Cas1
MEIQPRHFLRRAGACVLNEPGRKVVLLAYERRMDTLVTHPLLGYRATYRRMLEVQARLLGRELVGELPTYTGFITR